MINRHQLKATNLLSLQIFNLKFKLESQSIFITKHINTYIVFYFNLAKIFFFYWKLKSIIIKFFSNFFVSFFNSFWMFFWRINPIQDGLFRGCSRAPPSLKSVTHILQWWNLANLCLTQRWSKKYMNRVTLPLISADITIFSSEISKFCYIKKYRYKLYFDT